MLTAALCALGTCALAQQPPAGAIEATTRSGEKVLLLPGGFWEYADPKKAEPQREQRRLEEERSRASQGQLFGIGRRIEPGDKDYNRGTLNPNRR